MKLSVSKEQMEFLNSIGIEDREYTREEIESLVEGPIYDHLMENGWKPGKDFEETNEVGDLCESIITALTGGRS